MLDKVSHVVCFLHKMVVIIVKLRSHMIGVKLLFSETV